MDGPLCLKCKRPAIFQGRALLCSGCMLPTEACACRPEITAKTGRNILK